MKKLVYSILFSLASSMLFCSGPRLDYYYTIDKKVNIRAAPSIDDKYVIGVLNPGTALYILAKSQKTITMDGVEYPWLICTDDEYDAFFHADYSPSSHLFYVCSKYIKDIDTSKIVQDEKIDGVFERFSFLFDLLDFYGLRYNRINLLANHWGEIYQPVIYSIDKQKKLPPNCEIEYTPVVDGMTKKEVMRGIKSIWIPVKEVPSVLGDNGSYYHRFLALLGMDPTYPRTIEVHNDEVIIDFEGDSLSQETQMIEALLIENGAADRHDYHRNTEAGNSKYRTYSENQLFYPYSFIFKFSEQGITEILIEDPHWGR